MNSVWVLSRKNYTGPIFEGTGTKRKTEQDDTLKTGALFCNVMSIFLNRHLEYFKGRWCQIRDITQKETGWQETQESSELVQLKQCNSEVTHWLQLTNMSGHFSRLGRNEIGSIATDSPYIPGVRTHDYNIVFFTSSYFFLCHNHTKLERLNWKQQNKINQLGAASSFQQPIRWAELHNSDNNYRSSVMWLVKKFQAVFKKNKTGNGKFI